MWVAPTHWTVSIPSWRQPRPGDAGVVVALKVLDEACLLQAVQQPRHTRRRQHQQLDEVDTAQPVLERLGEVQERLEVVDRQPARAEDLGLELPAQHRMGPHQTGESGELNCLRAQYLTTQGLSSILVAYSRIHDTQEESNEHYSRADHKHSDRHLGPRSDSLRASASRSPTAARARSAAASRSSTPSWSTASSRAAPRSRASPSTSRSSSATCSRPTSSTPSSSPSFASPRRRSSATATRSRSRASSRFAA